MQEAGPYILIPANPRIPPRSVDPASPSRLAGKVVQVILLTGERLTMGRIRAIIVEAAQWKALSKSDRSALLMSDKSTYATLAQAAARLKPVEASSG